MSKELKHSATVLVVEDESSLNEAYQLILQQSGYTVIPAFNGKEALKLASRSKPDIILLDLRMPVLDGIGFLEQFNASRHPKTKIIVFSNYDMQKEIEEAYKLGAHRYMLKAWASPRELIQIIETTLNEDATSKESKSKS